MNFIDNILNYFSSEETPQIKSSRKRVPPFGKMPPTTAVLQHRDGGWDSGWGGHNPVYSQSGQTSPAVSALALLGFLFFLNLIQSSLSLNRQLMTTTVITANASASATAAGRETRGVDSDGTRGERQRRGVEELFKSFNRTNPDFLRTISSQPAHHQFLTSIPDSNVSTPSDKRKPNGRPVLNQLENPIAALPEDTTTTQVQGLQGSISEHLRIASLLSNSPWGWRRCIQLLMCNLGQRLHSSWGRESRTVLAIKLIGQHIISTLTPQSGWANQVARALMVGYRSKKDCGDIYKQCRFFSDGPDRKYNPILEAHT